MYQMKHFNSFFFKFKSNLLLKRVFFSLNDVFTMAILDVISCVHLASFVIMLTTQLIHSPVGFDLS